MYAMTVLHVMSGEGEGWMYAVMCIHTSHMYDCAGALSHSVMYVSAVLRASMACYMEPHRTVY